jgi:hypothetical protein
MFGGLTNHKGWNCDRVTRVRGTRKHPSHTRQQYISHACFRHLIRFIISDYVKKRHRTKIQGG